MRFVATLGGGLLALTLATGTAGAEPRPTMVQADLSRVHVVQPNHHLSNTIFLDRCKGGCTIRPGFEDSTTDHSSIIGGTVHITEFQHSDADWAYVVQCVKGIYEPFNVNVTDVDPGTASHFEAIVAGTPGEIGSDQTVGGLSPFTCGIIEDAITYTFANEYSDPQQICEVVAQETAHAFGLEHEHLCEDPMTYLSGCGNKEFQDVDADCGEFSARACQCSAGKQNSVQSILAIFGAGTPTPPTVTIKRPMDGATVQPSFAIEATAVDNVKVAKVEVYINGSKTNEATVGPFIFNAPATIAGGTVTVEVRATDNRGNVGKQTVTVTQGAPCSGDSCGDGKVCLSGRCLDGPGTSGGLGATCMKNGDCESMMCGEASGEKFCAAPCGTGCPSGFDCVNQDASGQGGVCWPGSGSGGGCGVTRSSAPAPLAPVGLAFVALLWATSRSRRRR